MKVTKAKVLLTAEDILNGIDEYVKVEGLKINKIEIGELITVFGSYKKTIEIPFKATVGIGNLYENLLNVKIFNVSISKFGILTPIKNFALKKVLKDFFQYGISIDKDNVILDVNLITKFVPFLYLKLSSVGLIKGAIEVEAEEIVYAPEKEALKFEQKKEESTVLKLKDSYSKLRENIENKTPDKYADIVEYAMVVPDITILLCRLFRDKRVDIKTKLLIGGVIAYLASPIDILPDFIPIIGKVDDVAMAFFAMNKIINEVPEEIILANWSGKANIILIVREGIKHLSKFLGSDNVAKLLGSLKVLASKSKKEEIANENSNDLH